MKTFTFPNSARRWVALFILLVLTGPGAWAQAPAWQAPFGLNTTNAGYSTVLATAADASGNLLVVGDFFGTVSFGNTTLTNPAPAGYLSDAFVAKWNVASNSFVWAYQIGNSGIDAASAVAVVGANIYVAGHFSGTTTFGTTALTSAGGTDVFVAKLVDSGSSATFAWVQQPTGATNEASTGLAVSGNQVYLTGTMAGVYAPGQPGNPGPNVTSIVNFGPTTIRTIGPTHGGFVAKLLDNGNSASFAWALAVSGGGTGDTVNAVAVNGSNVYVVGSFNAIYGPFFGPSTNIVIPPLSGSALQGFVAKLTDAGTTWSLAWAQRLGSEAATGTALLVDGANLYVAGRFGGSGSFGTTTLVAAARNDAYVTKLTDGGASATFAWAKRAGSIGDNEATALAVRGTSLYATGYFTGTTDFGGTILAGSPPRALFITKHDTGTGSFAWAQATGGTGTSNSYASALVFSGNRIFVAGAATPGITFSGVPFATQTGLYMGFLTSVTDPTLTATAPKLAKDDISLFPNPSHGRATVQLPTIGSATTATLTILDALGRAVRTQTALTSSKTELDLTSLVPGLYAVQVQAGTATATQRLVVE